MAKDVKDWINDEVKSVSKKSLRFLSEMHFFRDPMRPIFQDSDYFFSPADGILMYQNVFDADEPLLEIKGKNYTLKQALRNPKFDKRCLVIGIFMTSYDVHVNRIPYSGNLSYLPLPEIATQNHPMLKIEESLMKGHQLARDEAQYLFFNQRMLNKIKVHGLGLEYYVLQIADYDVKHILPFDLSQNQPVFQNERFAQIRFGSQVDLIVPLSERFKFDFLIPDRFHVEAGLDPLIKISEVGLIEKKEEK